MTQNSNAEIKIVSWNVNSINARMENFLLYLKQENPDVLLLQELKCEANKFPYSFISNLGYNIEISGQKSYNGVAILSKYPLEDVSNQLPNLNEQDFDEQARYIEAVISFNDQSIRVASIYVPNGGSELLPGQKNHETAKFNYKMQFFDRLYSHFKNNLRFNEIAVFGGDYNVAHHPIDVYDPKYLDGTICFHPLERQKFNALLNLGYFDSFRCQNPNAQAFSWWDYRGNGFKMGKGMRIDYLLTSPLATDKIKKVTIDDFMQEKPKASDHAPVALVLEI